MSKNLILIAAIAIIGAFSSLSSARLTGTNPTGASSDTWCVGKSSKESCVDYLGGILPTTANTQYLGTAALPWAGVYSAGVTNTGAESVTNNLLKVPVATQTVTSNGTISVSNACGGLLRLTFASGNSVTTNTTDTFTAPSPANLGCILYVTNVSTAGTIILDNNAHFDAPGSVDVTLGTNDGAIIIQGAVSWILMGTSDN